MRRLKTNATRHNAKVVWTFQLTDVKQGDAHLNALVSGKPRTLISGE